jgi:phage/conjugal plasmid C-4 type zinc finger TraR family protein
MADDVDVAQGNAERYIASAIHGVTKALSRIPEGAAADCEECGDEIPKARRDAVPWSRLCIGCAETREREAKGR